MKILSRRQCLLCVVRFLAQWAWLESVCVHDHSSALTSGIVLSFHQMENMKIPEVSSSTLIDSSCKKNSNLCIDIIAECTQKHSERNHIISQSFLEHKGFPIQLGVLPVAESSIMQNGESKISSYWLCRIIIDGALFQFSKAIWNMKNYFSILAKTMRDDVKMYSSFSLILKANVLWLRFAPKRMEIKWWSAFHESFGKLAKRSLFDNFVCISKPQFLLSRPCRCDGFHLYSWFSPQQRSKRLQPRPRQDLKGIACILWCKLSRETLSPPGTVETEFTAWRENLFWDNFRQSTALFFHVAAVTMNLIKSSSQTILHHPKALHNHSISLCHVRQRHRGSILLRKLGGNVNNHHCTAHGSGRV